LEEAPRSGDRRSSEQEGDRKRESLEHDFDLVNILSESAILALLESLKPIVKVSAQ
jgi:hypothetical protein